MSTDFNDGSSRLTHSSKLECKICWHVYDPAVGDEAMQIAGDTAFADLPDYWTCPECGAAKKDFLIIDD